MKICLSKPNWYSKENIWVTGYVRVEDKYLTKDELLSLFIGTESLLTFEKILTTANGQFSVIVKKDNEIWAASDRLRNYPLFYTRINEQIILSDNCYDLAAMQSEPRFDLNAVDSFLSTGFTINNLTLLENIYHVEAGGYVVLGSTVTSKYYHDCKLGTTIHKDLITGAEELVDLFSQTFKSHLTALKDKYIAIPLSGGFDSRLVAAMVAKYHPENVLCYTYGTRDNDEVAPARQVAKRLGLKWINIVYDSALIKDYIKDDVFINYFPFVSNLTSMFFMQEYFAVKYIKDNKLVPENCVFISGFSGDMLAGSYLIPIMKNKEESQKIATLIYNEYFRLVKLRKGKKNNMLRLIEERIPAGKSDIWKAIDTWDIKERHAKFIVNAAKVYTYFGYDYVFPLWDNVLVDYFMNLPFSLRINRALYEFTLKEYIFKDSGLNFKNETNPLSSQKKIQRIKEKIKPYLPEKIRNLFISLQNKVFYDRITELMREDINNNLLISPGQPNYYNSYITQWYLIKTYENLNICCHTGYPFPARKYNKLYEGK